MATLSQQLAAIASTKPGVTYMPPVRVAPPRQPAVPAPRGVRAAPQDDLTNRLIANSAGAGQRLAAASPAAQGGGGGLSGLGWIVGKPLQAGLKALSVLDYPRAVVNALVTEGAAELIQRMPDAGRYPALDTNFSWSDIGRNIKEHKGFGETLVEPIMGPKGDDWNIWVRRAAGLMGDLASDPLLKAGSGVEAIVGGSARAEYANKLLDAQQEVARKLAANQEIAGRLGEAALSSNPYAAAAQEAMGARLAQAGREIPQQLERQAALGSIEDVERIGRQGVGIANPAQLEEMGLQQHALRFGGVPIGRGGITTRAGEAISRGIAEAMGPVKGRIAESAIARGARSLRIPIGEVNQELRPAMERILTGRGPMSMERALRTIRIDQFAREGGSTFRGFATHAVRQMDEALKGMDGTEREGLLHAAEQGADNAVALGPKMVQAAKEAGFTIPEIEGQPYVPHVLTREAFKFLDRMRRGKNPLIDEFRRKIGVTTEDLTEEGGFLQRRIFRPDPVTGEPFKMKIGNREIVIKHGTLAELEDQLGGVLRDAGFEGKLYETDPVEAWKRYVIATEKDAALRSGTRRAARLGYEGLTEVDKAKLGPESYDPLTTQEILPTGPGGAPRQMAVENPVQAPKDSNLFEYVADEKATEARNRDLAQKIPRGKKAVGETQREIAKELETLGQAERENIAGRIDETAAAAWNPHREEMAALRKEERAARDQIEEATQQGQAHRLQLDQIDNAIAEADRNISSLQSRIGGITSQARRRVEVQSNLMLDQLTKELDAAQAERARLMAHYTDAVERAGQQLPAAERRAARRAVNEPLRRERDLTEAVRSAEAKLTTMRTRAENYLRGESTDPKTGKSRWVTRDQIKSAQARLDDPKLQREYNALFEERNAIASRRTQLADEAADHERNALDAIARANRAKGTYEEETQLQYALEQKRLANQKKAEAARLIDSHNAVQARISRSQVAKDREIVRRWNRQEANIDRFSRDMATGKTDVAEARRKVHEAHLQLEDFKRQTMQEAQYQAQPPPASLTEHYERELPKANQILESQPGTVFEEQVNAAQRTAAGAAEHTVRQSEIEAARKTVDESGEIFAKLNAKADLEAKLAEPEPTWIPDNEKRADFNVRHAEWADGRASAQKQLRKVNRQLKAMGDKVEAAVSARNRLNQLEAAAAREFENVPKAQRPQWYAELEARNQADIAKAGDLQASLQDVARKWEAPAAEAVAQEKLAAAKLGRAAVGGAEETAQGVPTSVEGIALQTARGTGELEGAMPEIAAARQRIEEIHAGQQLNEADRTVVEDAQAAWFAPYSQGVENQRVARARYAEIESKSKNLRQPRSAAAQLEGKRGGRPFGSQLRLVEPSTATPAQAAGNLAGVVGYPAYEAQPMYRTIEDINKIIAANPTGDDALMSKIEAEVGNHLTHLDQLTRQYDLPAHQLNRIIKAANNGTLAPVLQRQLKEGFKFLWDGGDVVIDKELERIYLNASKGLESKLFGRTFTMLTDFFKTYATLTPGFHVRNALSAIFMNSSEGVTMATQREGVQLWRAFLDAKDPYVWMRNQDDAVREAFKATFASGAGGQFMERGVSELRAGSQRASERIFSNKVTRLSQRVGADWVEGPVRLALALDSTRSGMSTIDAINRVTRIHFDYGQISRFDEKTKRVIPFWTFMSRNVPLQFTQMWTKPRTYLKYQSFVRNMTLGGKQDPLIPNYITQGGGFDTGIRTPDLPGWLSDLPVVGKLAPPGGMPVVLQPDLPHMRLQDDINRTAQALSGQNPGGVLSNVNPFFTAPFEYAMGKDFFTGKNYGPKDWSQAQAAGVPLAMLLSPIGGGKRGADGNWYLQDKSMNLLRSLIPILDKQSRLVPGATQKNSKDSARMLESYLRFLGAPVRTISDEQKQSELARRYYDARDAAVERAATGG